MNKFLTLIALFGVAAANPQLLTLSPWSRVLPAAPALTHVAAPIHSTRWGSPILSAPVVHLLKKRDLVAIGPAPLVHSIHTPLIGARLTPVHVAHPLLAAPVTHVSHISPITHLLKKRSAVLASPLALAAPWSAIHAGSLSAPLDEPIVAHAKAAQLIQQNTEALRNNIGGIPLSLPADTPEVAAGKVAHAIAHANQAAITSHGLPIAHGLPVAHSLWGARLASPLGLIY